VRVDVADKPLELSLQLHPAADISGTVEIDQGNNSTNRITVNQVMIQLTSESGFGAPPAPVRAGDDGTFTFKSVLPGEWRIRMMGQPIFIKSAWLDNNDVTGRPLDLTSGAGAPLRIVVSTNTATVRGSAPAGQTVFAQGLDDDETYVGWMGAQVDAKGQFTLQGLAPGKYRIVIGDTGSPVPQDGGQEVTLREGETATLELKPESKP
jgi:hypothetical protein